MRAHEYPLNNPSPPLPREYSMLQTHSPTGEEAKIVYDSHGGLNGSPDERYVGNLSPKYEASLLHEVKQDYGEKVKAEANQTYVTLPPFLN